MNSPGVVLTIGLVLAREAGVNDAEVDAANERSAKLLRFYIGKGAVPYGDHTPWMEGHEDNGKCGMAAVLFNALGEAKGAEFFSRMSVAAHGPERDCGHTGNYSTCSGPCGDHPVGPERQRCMDERVRHLVLRPGTLLGRQLSASGSSRKRGR